MADRVALFLKFPDTRRGLRKVFLKDQECFGNAFRTRVAEQAQDLVALVTGNSGGVWDSELRHAGIICGRTYIEVPECVKLGI